MITMPELPEFDTQVAATARQHLDQLIKPPGSLGRIEELAIRLAEMQDTSMPVSARKAMVICAADHGVVAEKVTHYPASITRDMVHYFLRGEACINVLANQFGLRLVVADVGVQGEIVLPSDRRACFLDYKQRPGTGNMVKEPAMSRHEAAACIKNGRQIAETVLDTGVDVLGLGEMGVGNTTASTALLCALLGTDPRKVTGPGTGLSLAEVRHKARVVQRALDLHRPNPDDALDVLAKVGGLEIGALAGCIIEAASARCPVVLDGFITGAAALIANALQPGVSDYLIASHCSREPGHQYMLSHLGLRPLFDLDLRLGEGSGAALAMGLVDAATAIMRDVATFSSAAVKAYDRAGEEMRRS